MAIPHLPIVHVPPPNEDQAAALRSTSEYLKVIGTQVATVLFGFPPLTPDTAALAQFSTQMLRGAALCEGLLDLTYELDRH